MNSTPSAPELRLSFSIEALTGEYLPLSKRGSELLEYIPITCGRVSGDIMGEIIPGGADWCLTRSDATYQVEARYLFRTDGGDIVDVVNIGYLQRNSAARPAPGTEEYFMTTPVFRTVAPHLQWLTRTVFVGRATAHGTHTSIDVYEVVG